MSIIAITDYITNPDMEREILGDLVGNDVGKETEVLMVWHDFVDGNYVDKLPNIRAVQRYGVGYDNLKLDDFSSRGIIACNNPDYGVDEVSDTSVAMILNISRGVSQYNHSARSHQTSWQENINPHIRRHSDMTVGVIGIGRIGGSVVLKCRALGFKMVVFDPYVDRGVEKMLGAKRVDSLYDLLKISDIVCVNAPLSQETEGMIDSNFIYRMKRGSSLVNTARGGLFQDLDVIYEALLSDQLSCFAADVLPEEPPTSNRLIDAWRKGKSEVAGRIIINPHTSYYSQQSVRELRINAAKNALRLYHGEEPHNKLC